MIRIGIVEDDQASATLLIGYLTRYENEHGVHFDIRAFPDGADFAARYRSDFDILLLDVELPGLDGFSAARHIRQVDGDVVIVFVTNMTHLAVKGYEVDALSYLVKPVPYFAFSQEIKRSVTRLRRRTRDYLMLAVEGGLARVATDDVLFMETGDHRTLVHTVDARYSVATPLRSFEEQLAGRTFFRCNSGYLVNLQHVQAIQGSTARMVGGRDLLVSRPRKKAFLAALTDHLGAQNA